MPNVQHDAAPPGSHSMTIRVSQDLHEALTHAGALRGISSMNEIMRRAALLFVADSAEDVDIVEDVRRRQEELRQRSEKLRAQTGRRPGHVAATSDPSSKREGRV